MPGPRVVAAEQFDRVQRRLAANRGPLGATPPTPTCCGRWSAAAVCRWPAPGVTRTASDTRYRYYRCHGQAARGRLRPRELLPRAVHPGRPSWTSWSGRDLCAVLRQPRLVAQALERAHSGAWVPQELRRGRRPYAASGERDPPTRTAAGGLPGRGDRPGHLPAAGPDLAAEAGGCWPAGARAEPAPRRAAGRGARPSPVDDRRLQRLRVGPGQAATFEQRRQLVELLIDRVVVTDGEVEIRYVLPTTPGEHPDAVLSLAYRLFPGRSGGHRPARPGPDRARRGRPTTATAPSAGGCGRGRARPGRGGWCRARSAAAHGCRGRGGAAAWDAAQPRPARSRCRTGRPGRPGWRSGSARWSGRRRRTWRRGGAAGRPWASAPWWRVGVEAAVGAQPHQHRHPLPRPGPG